MRRFFAENSFWNQPIGPEPALDPQSRVLLQFMAGKDDRGFWINLDRFTIPIYDVDAGTPRRKVHRRLAADGAQRHSYVERSATYLHPGHPMGQQEAFAQDAATGVVPVPDGAVADPESDHHLALVDWQAGWIWDMWGARRRADGDMESYTGMKYRVDGSGVFNRADFAVHNGESIHLYGPGRAAGVPIVAGTIRREEMLEGRIAHKLSLATQAAGLQKFVAPPAAWTDGGWPGGLPQGATVQLDPQLNLEGLGLSPGAKVVARALQEYGAVCVDVSGGHVLYGEGLYGDARRRTWGALLEADGLVHIKLENYRVLRMPELIPEGMGPRQPDGVYAG